MKEATIVGLGLAGSLLGIYLARRGYKLELFEARADLRQTKIDVGRSINLALSCRGLTGLAGVDIIPKVQKLMVPMRARAIHEELGEVKYQAFGRHQNEYINAVQRNELNKLLLDELESFPNVRCYFSMNLLNWDLRTKTLSFQNHQGVRFAKQYQHLIGADGANSFIRERLKKEQHIETTRTFLPHGYKELSIGEAANHSFAREHLHLWPRDSFLLLGNPNTDESITGSLFLAKEGKNSFAELDNEFKINQFMQQAFPDAFPVMPHLIDEFLNHPTGNMSTIKTDPWYYGDQCLLIGDAAHGVVPFFGQGMNSAFEDCRVLNELLENHQDDWERAMPAFYQARKPNTDAVACMSLDNYHEIQQDIRNERFNLKKQLEQALMHRYPNDYVSKHVLVMFTNTPYAQAQAVGEIQNEFLATICNTISRVEEVDWSKVDVLLKKYDKKLAKIIS